MIIGNWQQIHTYLQCFLPWWLPPSACYPSLAQGAVLGLGLSAGPSKQASPPLKHKFYNLKHKLWLGWTTMEIKRLESTTFPIMVLSAPLKRNVFLFDLHTKVCSTRFITILSLYCLHLERFSKMSVRLKKKNLLKIFFFFWRFEMTKVTIRINP